MRIAYFANPCSVHDCKWINHFARENDTRVICSPPRGKNLLSERVPLHPVLPPAFPFLNIFKRKKIISAVSDLVGKNKVQIIHSMYAVPNVFWVSYLEKPNHIITTRGSDILVDYQQIFSRARGLRWKITYGYFRKLIHQTFNEAKYITSTSVQQQDVMRNFVKNYSRMHLIRTGVDAGNFLKAYNKEPDDRHTGTVLFSPRSMKPEYNIHLIIEALEILVKKMSSPNTRLVLINDNTDPVYGQRVTGMVREKNLSAHCSILPKQDPEGMVRLYRTSDMVIMIPQSDGTPVSGIEAMLAQKILIVGNASYDRDIFNPGTCWSLRQNTAEELAETVAGIVTTDGSKQETAYRARETAVLRADFNKEIEKVQALYVSMIN